MSEHLRLRHFAITYAGPHISVRALGCLRLDGGIASRILEEVTSVSVRTCFCQTVDEHEDAY